MTDSSLRCAFGTTNPRITRFPHCIFPASEASLRKVAEEVGGPIGIWGNGLPLVDASGDGYAPPWYDPSISAKDFKLWELPANQEHAMDYGGRLPSFIAAIAADTSEELLVRMYGADVGESVYEYDKCMNLLADWIDELGWAYVPLEYEAVYALFVAAPRNHALVGRVKARLVASEILPVFEVALIDGRQVWCGPHMVDPDTWGRVS